jgi:hypothetical protein
VERSFLKLRSCLQDRININTKLNDAGTTEKYIPYVRSDEKVGCHDTIITSIFYLVLGVAYAYVFLLIYLVYWSNITGSSKVALHNRSKRKIALYIAIIVVV